MVSKIVRIGNQIVSIGGDVLSAPNPELEVNEIGVEVSEKIAEDVKEGDVLFKKFSDFDISLEINPGGRSTNGGCLFELADGTLHSWYVQGDGPTGFYRYVNNRWERNIQGAADEGQWNSFRPTGYYSNERAVPLSDGRAIISAPLYSSDGKKVPFFIGVYEGGSIRDFSNFSLEPSAIPLHRGDGMSQGQRQYISNDMIEHNGKVHLLQTSYPYGQYDYTTSSDGAFHTYILDLSSETITQVHNPFNDESYMGSGTYDNWYSCRFAKHDGKLYALLIRSVVPREIVLCYDKDANDWIDVSRTDTFFGVRYSDVLTDSSGNLWWAATNNGGPVANRIKLTKFNPSTSAFDVVASNGADLSSIAGFEEYGGNIGAGIGLYEHNNSIYIVFSKQVLNKFDEHYGGVLKYDGSSTLEPIPDSLMGFRNYEIGSRQGAYTFKHPDIIKHNGEIHLQIKTDYAENTIFLKADETGEVFKRNCFWATPPSVGDANLTFHTVSGITLAASFGNGYDESKIHEFITSGDPSGYFLPWSGYDINPQGGDAGFFYEDSGNLILFGTNRWNSGNSIFQYLIDVSGRQAYKLESPSSLPSNVHTMGHAEHSGINYVAVGTFSSPYIESFYLDGSTVVKLPDVSSIPRNINEQVRTVDIVSNGTHLIMTAVKDLANDSTSNDNLASGFLTYKFNGSGWDEVQSPRFNLLYDGSSSHIWGETFERSTGLTTFVMDGEIYALGLYFQDPTVRLYKYIDTSGWVEQLKNTNIHTDPNSDIKKVYHDGKWWFQHFNNIFSLDSNLNFKVYESNITNKYNPYKKDPLAMYSVNNDLYIFRGPGGHPTLRQKLSDYAGEFTWYKNLVRSSAGGKPIVAYGIALQDGSKGDIIKIRRIKQ